MRYIPLSQIIVPESRQRSYFDEERLADLEGSIDRLGLIHPLVVTADNRLVSGERRLRAISVLHDLGIAVRYDGKVVPADHVPAVLPSEAGVEELYELELEENIQRENLSWQEKADAIRRLHEMRATLAAAEGRTHTMPDTAEEVTGRRDAAYLQNVRRSVTVAQHLADPEIAKAKSVDDAYKILQKREDVARNTARALEVGATATASRYTAHNVDCLEWLRNAAPAQFDVICTDPPYGMGADQFGDAAGKLLTTDHQYDDSQESFRTLMTAFAPLVTAVAKPQAHLYLCCDIDQFIWLRQLFLDLEWWVHRTPLINIKREGGRVPWPEHGPRRAWELVLYAVRGKKPTTAIYTDLIETKGDDNLGHGAQKPVAMYVDMLKRSCRPGDSVLDPFGGTGTLIPAAHELSLYATVLEQNPAYYGICLKRLEQLQ